MLSRMRLRVGHCTSLSTSEANDKVRCGEEISPHACRRAAAAVTLARARACTVACALARALASAAFFSRAARPASCAWRRSTTRRSSVRSVDRRPDAHPPRRRFRGARAAGLRKRGRLHRALLRHALLRQLFFNRATAVRGVEQASRAAWGPWRHFARVDKGATSTSATRRRHVGLTLAEQRLASARS